MNNYHNPGRQGHRHSHRCSGPAVVRYLWDNLNMGYPLFKKFSFLSINFKNIILDLSSKAEINDADAGSLVNRIKWILQHNSNGFPGIEVKNGILTARHRIAFFNSLNYDENNEKRFVSPEELAERGFDETSFLATLRQVSTFAAWAYNLEIPQKIQELLKKPNDTPRGIPDDELDISEDDLALNKWHRFPFIIIIDTSLSMGEDNCLELLQQGLTGLFHEIGKNHELSRSIELYVATCGKEPTEIVDFAMIDKQELRLDGMLLSAHGSCMMADTILMALERLEKRLKLLRTPAYDINYYKPWMLILSNGKFKGDMQAALEAIRNFPDLQVYARGVSPKARLENLKTLDSQATILSNMSGFFTDVFDSIGRSQSSIPGGENIQLVSRQGYENENGTSGNSNKG